MKSEKCRCDEGLLLLPSKFDELITADNAGAVPDLATLPCRALFLHKGYIIILFFRIKLVMFEILLKCKV